MVRDREQIELRALTRRRIIGRVAIYNQATDELLGYIADITVAGLKLISNRPVKTGESFHLRMVLPEENFSGMQVGLTAKSIWTGEDISSNGFATGFRITDLAPATEEIIRDLIEKLAVAE
jgi:hypothetical protein